MTDVPGRGGWSDGLRLAVGTLTVIPSGPVEVSPASARAAMLLAPAATLPLAVAAGGATATPSLGVPPAIAAVLVLVVLAVGSRALHLDGLADTVDALGGGWTRERALTILRSGDVGPMGVVALVLVLLLQAAALTELAGAGWRAAAPVAAAVALSRVACALACRAGTEPAPGSRMAAAFVGTVPPTLAALPLAAGAVALGAAGLLLTTPVRALVVAVVPGAGVVVVVGVLRALAARRLGGVGGDAIGASVELALAAVLVTLATGWR